MLVFNDGCGCDSDAETERVAVRKASKYSSLLLPFLRRVRGTTDSFFRQKRRMVISSFSKLTDCIHLRRGDKERERQVETDRE